MGEILVKLIKIVVISWKNLGGILVIVNFRGGRVWSLSVLKLIYFKNKN